MLRFGRLRVISFHMNVNLRGSMPFAVILPSILAYL